MAHEKEKEIKSLHCYKDVRNLEAIGTFSPSYDSINIQCRSSYGCLFGPPGSESGSWSLYHRAKIVRKPVLWLLYEVLPLKKNDENVPSKSNKKKIVFC